MQRHLLVLLFSLLFIEADLFAANKKGKCGENLMWSLNLSTGEMLITGTGAMFDYQSYMDPKAPWDNYRSSIKRVSFSKGITHIGNNAFHTCSNLVEVSFPSELLSVGDFAFSMCKKLESVQLPNGVIQLGVMSFYACHSISSVIIPERVSDIGEAAFSGCTMLKAITVSPRNTHYSSLDGVLYDYSHSRLIVYPGGKEDAIYKIPDEVSIIENNSFIGAHLLETVEISAHVSGIKTPFGYGCDKLINTFVDDKNLYYQDIEGVLYSKNTATIIYYPSGREEKSYAILGGTRIVGKKAFEFCKLEEITIPNSIIALEDLCFSSCTSMQDITIPNSVVCIGDFVFSGCKSLDKIVVLAPKDKISIGVYAIPDNAQLSYKNSNESSTPNINGRQLPVIRIIDGSFAFVDSDGDNAIGANEATHVVLKVRNDGNGVCKGCEIRVALSGDSNGIRVHNQKMASLAPGQETGIDIPVVSNMDTKDGKVTFNIEVFEPNGFGLDPLLLTVPTRSFEAPHLQIVDYAVTGIKGGTLTKKNPFSLQAILQNTQHGRAEKVQVKISVPDGVFIMDGQSVETYSVIEGGQTESMEWQMIVNGNYAQKTIPINISLSEKYGKFAEDQTITLSLDQALSSTILDIQAIDRRQPHSDIHIASIKSDVDKDIPVSSTKNKNTFVVIIANEIYEQVANVPYALNDGNIFQQYCEKTLGIPSSNVHYVANATINNIRQQVNWLSQVTDAFNGNAKAIFYYAGHGVPDEKSHNAFLLPVDGSGSDISTGYKLDDLYATLGAANAQSVTIILDACFSGSKREDGMLVAARGVAIKAKKSQPIGNMVVFAAASGDETAYPNNKEGHGMFTYFLLKILKDTKGNATYDEISSFVRQNVLQQSVVINGKTQTPTITSSDTALNWREWKFND